MTEILLALGFVIGAPLVGGILAGLDRVLSARMQGRVGPPLVQPFFDVAKLLRKENLIINRYQNLFLYCFLVFTVFTGVLFIIGGDFLIILFAFTLADIFFVMSGFVSNSPYSHIGSERELIQMMAHEPIVILTAIGRVFENDLTVGSRLKGVGVITKDEAFELGAVGPTGRASGLDQDIRRQGYSAYKHLEFEPITETAGDCHTRCRVRFREMHQSVSLIGQAVSKIEEGPIDVKVTGTPSGEFFARTEQPRGEVVYYLKANGTKNLERMRVRTPTFDNLAVLLKTLKGCDLADVPVLVLTIDPCVSCTER